MKKTASIILTFLFVLTLASCASMKKKIVGTYELTKAEGSGISITEQQLQAAKLLGMTATLEVRSDGTATLDVFGEKTELTYNLDKMVFTNDGDDAKFTFDGKTIVISEDDTRMEFKKVEK